MPLFRRSKKFWLYAPMLAVGAVGCAAPFVADNAFASVQTYTDQVLAPSAPDAAAPGPISPGEISLHDVIAAHQAQRKPSPTLEPPVALPAATAAAPLLKPPTANAGSESVMMMQGLKAVLQQSGAASMPTLKPPVVHHDASASSGQDVAPTAPTPDVASGVQYQSGQEPKSLGAAAPAVSPAAAMPTAANAASEVDSGAESATNAAPPATTTTIIPLDQIASPPAAPATESSSPNAAAVSVAEPPVAVPEPTQQPAPPESAAPAAVAQPEPTSDAEVSAASNCKEQVTSWTKTCLEAGYPANYVGAINGESRTTCPDSALHDVWISNTCAPPVVAADSSIPLSAPVATQPTQPQAVAPATAESIVATGENNDSDASCGPANGLAADARPSAGLCNAGTTSDVTGEGPWRWSCQAIRGNITVSCAAPAAPKLVAPPMAASGSGQAARVVEDGQCGTANGVSTDYAPELNLCLKGVASRVNGDGPWTWACSGMNGGQAVSCNAPRRIEGVCGSAGSTGTNQRPASNLCSAGYASAVTGDGPWSWTCSGLYGGQAATCSASPRQDAVCGGASLKGQRALPVDNLCSIGVASHVTGNGPWSWSCNGLNGGSSVSCEAPAAVSGACGAANGVAVAQAPSDDLCRTGNATRVTGLGPWQWNCLGAEGGDAESCTAPRASAPAPEAPLAISNASAPAHPAETSPVTAMDMCGGAAELAALAAPQADLCKSGTASEVGGNGPWTWTCADDSGHSSSCSTLSPGTDFKVAAAPREKVAAVAPSASTPTSAPEESAACGSAAGQGLTEKPSDNLCAFGKASKISGSGPWAWTCTKGKSQMSCEAVIKLDGTCGAANGTAQANAPTTGFCNTGTATQIQGSGPWLWSCVGSGGGSSASCSAQAQAQTRVDGVCGAVSNAPTATAPASNLCDGGTASTVYGDGPWTWTCSGMNGGIASSCSAQRTIPPAPPPPGPSVDGLCGSSNGVALDAQPTDNLCTTGTPTATSGQGPWNWNCLGQNGGMTVSCTASLQPPAPITGMCGAASGVPTLTSPRSGLCSAGITSAVSGNGPWTWSCSGTNGGGAVGCVAPLAGTTGGGSLPSLVTTPRSGGTQPVAPSSGKSGGLVTPQLPTGNLPPLETGTLPQPVPSKSFDSLPVPSAAIPTPAIDQNDLSSPTQAPDLPAGTTPLQPPPIRDTLKPSEATRPVGFDAQGNLIPGNHFKLDDDVSTVSFPNGSENFDVSVTPTLDKLAAALGSNTGVRITLTAYAGTNATMNPREARRLSLTRALAIRDYLTAKGISSARIDVRALGANVPSGDPDRVDIKAN